MVHRYHELIKFLVVDDDDIVELLPSPACNRHLKTLYAELKGIESVSKALQAKDITLLDVRVWFDGLIAARPNFADYIGKYRSADLLY
ncbi:hypothetical protein PF007_g7220 [Phytophthora fragariae]|uniref:Uncharacterized protein n=1 Tax=Phytophthora fragariae TaxID=53985 RepID=A0A6A3U875_9STRA|nr:hypothetical protein PF003_g1734 [Phytophthora fragariae]KAE9123019.1 hypothetical protein PF007_g7220 [Phytophthora fragariae]KAE9147718.1 hypothetical protein PF006_g7630 [Phytophthora fragariae]